MLARSAKPWYEEYAFEKPLIAGHRDYLGNGQPFVYKDLVYGIDTSCCQGGRLTGLLLPSFRFVSVPSRFDHWTRRKSRNPNLQYQTTPVERLTWSVAANMVHQQRDHGEQSQNKEEIVLLLTMGEEALKDILYIASSRHTQIMAEIKACHDLATLSDPFLAKLYAQRAKPIKLQPFLHRIRKGTLTIDSLRVCLRGPSDAVSFLRSIIPEYPLQDK